MSGRKVGMVATTVRSPASPSVACVSVAISIAARRSTACSMGMSKPARRPSAAIDMLTLRGTAGAGYRSTASPARVPPPRRTIIAAARSPACGMVLASTPRSKRCDASECRPRRLAVRRTLRGSNVAASSSTSVVSAETSLVAPPITPASATGPRPSAMTTSCSCRARSTPSSVVMRSPRPARRTTMPPLSLARSKACSGCPSSSIT